MREFRSVSSSPVPRRDTKGVDKRTDKYPTEIDFAAADLYRLSPGGNDNDREEAVELSVEDSASSLPPITSPARGPSSTTNHGGGSGGGGNGRKGGTVTSYPVRRTLRARALSKHHVDPLETMGLEPPPPLEPPVMESAVRMSANDDRCRNISQKAIERRVSMMRRESSFSSSFSPSTTTATGTATATGTGTITPGAVLPSSLPPLVQAMAASTTEEGVGGEGRDKSTPMAVDTVAADHLSGSQGDDIDHDDLNHGHGRHEGVVVVLDVRDQGPDVSSSSPSSVDVKVNVDVDAAFRREGLDPTTTGLPLELPEGPSSSSISPSHIAHERFGHRLHHVVARGGGGGPFAAFSGSSSDPDRRTKAIRLTGILHVTPSHLNLHTTSSGTVSASPSALGGMMLPLRVDGAGAAPVVGRAGIDTNSAAPPVDVMDHEMRPRLDPRPSTPVLVPPPTVQVRLLPVVDGMGPGAGARGAEWEGLQLPSSAGEGLQLPSSAGGCGPWWWWW